MIRQSPSRPSHAEVGGRRRAVDVRAGGQLDRHVDRPAVAAGSHERSFGALTSSWPCGVLDAGLLGGLDVLVVGRVARAHLDDGVGAVAGA